MLAHLASAHLQLDFYNHLIGGEIYFPQRCWGRTSWGVNLSALRCDAARGNLVGSVSVCVFTQWRQYVLVSHLWRRSIIKKNVIQMKHCRFHSKIAIMMFCLCSRYAEWDWINGMNSTAQSLQLSPRNALHPFTRSCRCTEILVPSHIPKTLTWGCITTPKDVLGCRRLQQWSGNLSRLWSWEAPRDRQTPPVHESRQLYAIWFAFSLSNLARLSNNQDD